MRRLACRRLHASSVVGAKGSSTSAVLLASNMVSRVVESRIETRHRHSGHRGTISINGPGQCRRFRERPPFLPLVDSPSPTTEGLRRVLQTSSTLPARTSLRLKGALAIYVSGQKGCALANESTTYPGPWLRQGAPAWRTVWAPPRFKPVPGHNVCRILCSNTTHGKAEPCQTAIISA